MIALIARPQSLRSSRWRSQAVGTFKSLPIRLLHYQ
jgi:hypothetical protein